MKKILKSSMLLALLGLIISCAPQGENEEQMLKDAKALDQKFVEAYNNSDVDGVMETYWNSPDLVSYPPGDMEENGWDDVKKGIKQFFNSVKDINLILTDMNYKAAGDVVISWGTWTMTMPDGNGGRMEMKGRYTDVKAKRDGKWVYIMDHASVPLPPPSDSPEMP